MIKIECATIEDNGKSVTLKLKGADKNYRYIFLDAENLPLIADFTEKL